MDFMTTQPINVNYDDVERLTVSGRELHKALDVKTAYKDWFPRMCEYGFVESVDFNPLKNEQVHFEGNRQVKRAVTDHQITIPISDVFDVEADRDAETKTVMLSGAK